MNWHEVIDERSYKMEQVVADGLPQQRLGVVRVISGGKAVGV